jgi:hypothetical protein
VVRVQRLERDVDRAGEVDLGVLLGGQYLDQLRVVVE